MNEDILLEIGTEEIPSGYILSAVNHLKEISENELKSARIEFKKISIYATPRRLVLYAEDVAEQQLSLETEISGPNEKAAFIDGKPTNAALGFAKKYGVEVSELHIKDGRVCILKKEPSLQTEKVLPEVFVKIISKISFPKTMIWESSKFRFVRPIRWITALYGKKVIKFQIADVKSSNCTWLSYNKKIKVTNSKKFVDVLRN
jgi:glycyl-tRNA synthetase beta chain